MSDFWRGLDWGNWAYGLLWAGIGGGASALAGGVGATLADPKNIAVGSWPFFKVILVTFVLSAATHGAAYLATHPLPVVKVTRTETETSVDSTQPGVVTTSSVQETVVLPADKEKKIIP